MSSRRRRPNNQRSSQATLEKFLFDRRNCSRLQVIALAGVLAAAMLLWFLLAVTAAMLLLLVFFLIAVLVMDFDEFWDWFGAFNCWLWLPDWCWVVAVDTLDFGQDVCQWCFVLAKVVLCEFILLISYLSLWINLFEIAVVQTFPLTYIAINGWLYD